MQYILTDVIPIMTSNTAPSGIASASAIYAAGSDAWYAFDKKNTTVSGHDGWMVTLSTGQWLSYEFPVAKIIYKYTIAPPNSSGRETRCPKSWIFQGSNDGGSTWANVDTQTNVTGWAVGTKKEFTISTPNAYKKYRLSVSANNGDTYVSIGQLEMMEMLYSDKALILSGGSYKKYDTVLGWQNVTSATPTESDYSNGNNLEEVSSISESAWSQLTGNVELYYYTDNPTKTEVQFGIETTPFTLAQEWEDKTIKVVEYTDNPALTESVVTLDTEPFSIYEELGDTVDVLYYTDNTSKTSANLTVTANYTPLDEIDSDFDVVTWTNADIEVGHEPTLTYEALPFEQLIITPYDIASYGTIKTIVAKKINQSVEGTLRFIVSFDSGVTWKSYRFGKWKIINITNTENIRRYGMTVDTINTIPESALVGLKRVGYYLDNSIHRSAEIAQLDSLKISTSSPTQDVKFSDVAFYLLNTIATIKLSLQGNKIVGTLDDSDTGKVQYRVLLNGNPYYPLTGEFSSLAPSPLNIQLNLNEKDIKFGQDNVLRVEFQDYWGQMDFWEKPFVGTYSGIMFKDETGTYLSNSFGEILKHLDFGVVIAGQTTLEQKVIVKNQLGVQVQNLILEVQKEKLPEGVKIEMSRSNFPFTPEDPLLFNMFFNADEEFEFYTRIVTDIQAPPAANGEFEVRAKADPV
ncbi:hypothetical protein [Paenibacillus tianjinensis]|uniref:F5/8 type C domain-containing protein n=1 Tax=Paenibacillus tianjinensis TaxID=2810347 RepID=A0ABX7L6J9_9BACL|nr:hypothetical protein [Paenibacillus tianjinensis]QSF43567.1 hypothetical protein JRJ22_20105 [Paenibacillus tianjinensis]